MKRLALVVLMCIAMLLAGSVGNVLGQEATATPNATQAMGTAYASLATPDFSSTVKYGDIAETGAILFIGLIVAVLFLLWLVNLLLPEPTGK